MSQRDGFTGGFIAGAIVGGFLGGVIGAIVASGRNQETESTESSLLNASTSDLKPGKVKKRQLKDADTIEVARRGLEDKIAQLNSAIDEVRLSLGRVNENAAEPQKERSLEP